MVSVFARQHSISQFIVDFYCAEKRLIVEVDGPVHERQRDYDQARDNRLAVFGFRVLRFTNDGVLLALRRVVHAIGFEAATLPLSEVGEGAGG